MPLLTTAAFVLRRDNDNTVALAVKRKLLFHTPHNLTMTIASCRADRRSTIAIPIFHINSVPNK